MRTLTNFILLLPGLAAAKVIESDASTTSDPRPALTPTSGIPLVTASAALHVLEWVAVPRFETGS
jgi:hypothetical protein